jgi:hypothetical protein
MKKFNGVKLGLLEANPLIRKASIQFMATKQTDIAVMLSICIQNVLSSNLGWDISYSDRGSSWFSSIPTGMC